NPVHPARTIVVTAIRPRKGVPRIVFIRMLLNLILERHRETESLGDKRFYRGRDRLVKVLFP
ncbi:MAG TPA: hypothetical protein PLK94_06560, partial [Alphaproteobacteria bacterium]|nr:hypothetical protein [Alphaproteobacteria bacterium]